MAIPFVNPITVHCSEFRIVVAWFASSINFIKSIDEVMGVDVDALTSERLLGIRMQRNIDTAYHSPLLSTLSPNDSTYRLANPSYHPWIRASNS
jgi:hypothetical protein